jgi:hypothetical protein
MLLVKEFADQLGLADLLNQQLKVKQRHRGYSEAEAVLGLVYNTVVGGDCLSDLEVLRGDPGTKELIGMVEVSAPTTAGEHLRKFNIGSIHDRQRVNQLLQQQVRAAASRSEVCTLDLDSRIYEQASKKKEGCSKAYNGEAGYTALFAFWDETGELVMSHLRRGSAYTASTVVWFLNQTIKRVPEAGTKVCEQTADSTVGK